MKNILAFLFILCCFNAVSQSHFTRIPGSESGIKFANAIVESSFFNSFTYPYIYNGAGVAAGDINNDGFTDLFFSSNFMPNKLYLNLGNFKFRDISDESGISSIKGFFTGVTMTDINNDGYLDIYICKTVEDSSINRRNVLFINNKNLTFTDKAAEYGIADESFSTQAYFNDMDLDGDVDLFLVNYPSAMNNINKIIVVNKGGKQVASEDTTWQYNSYRYYENNNGKFTDKTFAAGLNSFAFGLSAVIDDFNNDGYPDIYCCNDFYKPDYLYINNKNGTYTNRINDYFSHQSFNSMGSDYADINNDGQFDLFVADMLPTSLSRQKKLKGPPNYDYFQKMVDFGYDYQYAKNVLHLNNGNKTYSDISYYAGVTFTEWSWTPILADFDNDGLKDLFITNGLLHDVTDLDFTVFRADSLKKVLFATKSTADALTTVKDIPSIKVKNMFFHNQGQMKFEAMDDRSGFTDPSWSNGAIAADLDNDGDLDLVINNINEEAFIYKNNAIEKNTGNYIRFRLNGPDKNKEGLFALVEVETTDGMNKQVQRYYPTRGYLSCHEHFLHFGLRTTEYVNVKVTWPDHKIQRLKNIHSNSTYTLNYYDAVPDDATEKKQKTIFRDITAEVKVNYLQKESSYIDFKLEPLLTTRYSRLGPCIAVADVNNDGLDDFYIGGSEDVKGELFLQKKDATFYPSSQQAFETDKKYEDTGSIFFDADNDGDKDLLVCSGGNESPDDSMLYVTRLYINNGKGVFSRDQSFPLIITSSKGIAAGDFDNDGWTDLFVGGKIVPGHYGRIPRSFLLKNNKGKFSDITSSVPSLSYAGMINDAAWADMDGNGFADLILAGEWMPLTIYKNNNGVLSREPYTISGSSGWWNTITIADADNDGDKDIIGGNEGLNSRYQGNNKEPVTMVVNDFDKNGSTDCLIELYENGKLYPVALRDIVLDQMNFLKKRFLRYGDYAHATLEDMFTSDELKDAQYFKAGYFSSSVFINDGACNFTVISLPARSQLAPVNAIVTDDVDKDGKPELLIAGNNYSTQVEVGRSDAGIGLLLFNQGNTYKSIPVSLSGFYVPGDVKCLKKINVGGKTCFIAGKNMGRIQFIGYAE